MFFCRRRSPLLTLLLMMIGFKVAVKGRLSEDERKEYREKRKQFRRKMREAFEVWDDDDDVNATTN